MKICILCGGVGHNQSECPWLEAQKKYSVAPLFFISIIVALSSIASAIALSMWLHGVGLSLVQAMWLLLEVFLAVSGSTVASTSIYKAKFWRRWLAFWRYRKIDPNLCCCGSQMGCGGSICYHGGCRNAKEYAIKSDE